MTQTDAAILAELIKTRLLGVVPEDQDLELEDDDWRLILEGLRLVNATERTADLVADNAKLREAIQGLLGMPGNIDVERNPPEMQQLILIERRQAWANARQALAQQDKPNAK